MLIFCNNPKNISRIKFSLPRPLFSDYFSVFHQKIPNIKCGRTGHYHYPLSLVLTTIASYTPYRHIFIPLYSLGPNTLCIIGNLLT